MMVIKTAPGAPPTPEESPAGTPWPPFPPTEQGENSPYPTGNDYPIYQKRNGFEVFIKALAIVISITALAVAVWLFLDSNKGTDNKQALGEALATYYEENGYDKLSEFFLIDLDGDGTEEGVANTDKRLVVCQAGDDGPKTIYDKEVAEWVWIKDRGVFAVFSDSKKSGSACWMQLKDGEMMKDETRDHYHFKGKKYFSNTAGQDISITEKQYYAMINSIVAQYTKLEPLPCEQKTED
jgi:hypothetical protein